MNKERICELVQKINDILYNEMGITTFKERVILLGCTAIVEKEKILHKNWNDFINCLCDEVSKKDNILVKELKKIKPTLSDNLDNFIKYVNEINFHEHDVMAIFFKELNKYKTKSDGGQVFTPQHIASFMCRLIECNKNDRILDATCGSGTFLVEGLKYSDEVYGNELY